MIRYMVVVVHGSGPGEIVFRHMNVVQRGVRSPIKTLQQAREYRTDFARDRRDGSPDRTCGA
jgi:hypothetical protein